MSTLSKEDAEYLQRSITVLTAKIEAEEQAFRQNMSKRKATVNELCAEAGIEPKYPDINDDAPITVALARSSNGAVVGSIKRDEFFGKSLSGSIRRVLELRKAANMGPATIEDIYKALVQGDYDFGTKNVETAIQGLTVSIGKNSAMFVKTPSGLVGLKEWYPGVRSGRRSKDESFTLDDEQPEETEQSGEQEQK